MMSPNQNLVGTTIERWDVLGRVESNKHGQAMWLCRCVCGIERPVLGSALRNGYSKSCGCLQKEIASGIGKLNGLPNNEALKNAQFRDYIRRTEKNGMMWGLTRTEFDSIVQSPCFYCKSQPTDWIPRFKTGRKYVGLNGIDRKDSSLGYVEGNVVPCCSVCNYMKGAMSIEDFLQHVARIQASLTGDIE